MAYATQDYYSNSYEGTAIPSADINKALALASKRIDTLTFNRIAARGMVNLTQYQQEVIQDACCELADFEYTNADMIQSVFKQYSINGTSMTLGAGWTVTLIDGIVIRQDIYEDLCKSGLCRRCV